MNEDFLEVVVGITRKVVGIIQRFVDKELVVDSSPNFVDTHVNFVDMNRKVVDIEGEYVGNP